MKKLVYLFAVALTLMSCGTKTSKDYVFQSTVGPQYAGLSVEIYDDINGVVIDSTVIDAAGDILIKGKMAEPTLATIKIDGQNAVNFIVEADTLTWDLQLNGVTGGEQNSKWMTVNQVLVDKSTSIAQEYRSYMNDTTMDEVTKKAMVEAMVDKFEKFQFETLNGFYSENKDNLVGALAFLNMIREIEPAQFTPLYEGASDQIKNLPEVKSMQEAILASQGTAEGSQYKDFTISDGNKDGSAASLSDYVGQGKYVLVDFFASWCGPCKREIPNLARASKEYADNLIVLSVAVWDKRPDTEKAVENENMTWPIIYNGQKIPTDIYGIKGIPEILLINPEGVIVKRGLRGDAIFETMNQELNK